MFFNRYFAPSFALVIVIALLHYLALEEAYYWTVWWYDIMMHFLGGLWVALFVAWVCASGKMPFLPRRMSWAEALSIVIIVGVAWEFYELAFKLTFLSDPDYWPDTTLDLAMDTAGGIVGAFFLSRNRNA